MNLSDKVLRVYYDAIVPYTVELRHCICSLFGMLEALVAKKLLPFLWVVANTISSLLKRIWHEHCFLLIWKAFRNTKECRFSFWNIFFRFRDIDIFRLCKLDQWWRHKVITFCNKNDFIIFAIKTIKILNKQYL